MNHVTKDYENRNKNIARQIQPQPVHCKHRYEVIADTAEYGMLLWCVECGSLEAR